MGKSLFVCELFSEFRPEIWQGGRSRWAEQHLAWHFCKIPTLDWDIHSRKSGKNRDFLGLAAHNFWTTGPIRIKFSTTSAPNISLSFYKILCKSVQIPRRRSVPTTKKSGVKNFNFCVRCWEWINSASGKVKCEAKSKCLTFKLLWWVERGNQRLLLSALIFTHFIFFAFVSLNLNRTSI